MNRRALAASFLLAFFLLLVGTSAALGALQWVKVPSGTTQDLYDVEFADANAGWAVGLNGTIVRTTDGGQFWTPQSSSTASNLMGVYALDNQHAWAVGSDGLAVKTRDGGSTWEPLYTGTSRWLGSVHFFDLNRGWAAGFWGTIIRTTDGGDTWSTVQNPYTDSITDMDWIDANHGWMVASSFSGNSGVTYRTIDGGTTWWRQSLTSRSLWGVDFVDALNGWAVGWEGTILRTRDGGQTWEPQSSGTTMELWSVHFVTQLEGWAVGDYGNILHTNDGGDTWGPAYSGVTKLLEAVYFFDDSLGWAVGQGGTVLALKDAPPATTTTTETSTTTTLPPTTTTTALPTTTTTLPTTTTVPPTTTTTTTVPAPGFSDVGTAHPYYTAIAGMHQAGIIDGYSNGNFGPGDAVMRQQFAKMICGTLGVPVTESLVAPFSDLGPDDPADLYPHDYIAAAASYGITNGTSPGVFSPWADITRAQVVTMIVRGAQSLKPGALATPPAGYTGTIPSFSAVHSPNMRLAEYNGLMTGLVGFGPGWNPWAKATRGEVAQLLWNLWQK